MSASTAPPAPSSTATSMPPPDPRFATLASEEQIARTIAALEQNGIHAVVVTRREDAVQAVLDLIPPGAKVLDAASQTLATLGLTETLADVSRFHGLRSELMRLREAKDSDGMRRLAASPDVVVGSVHALTEKGQAVIASATGSQLAPYAYGAGRVIWVVGTQKIVPDLDGAFDRIQKYTYPLENARALKAYGAPSFVAKLLVVNREFAPGRIHVVLLRENLGF
jgi:L-lactate utilization protein LutC